MGDLSGIMGMLPGMGALKKQMSQTKLDPKLLTHQEAIILSMTPKERENPALIKASRKKRIAAGCGLSVQDVNKLLKQYQTMSTMIKKMGKMGKKGLFGGMPKMDPSMLEGDDMPDMSKLPKGFPGAGGGLPPGFPGLGGGGLPPGFPGFGKKK